MNFVFALKSAFREFFRNLDSIGEIQPPYGNQFNSRISQKTSNNISKIISEIDGSIFENIRTFDIKRQEENSYAFSADWIDMIYILGLIKITAPKKILELGSGVSTCAIASLLSKSNYNSEFVSLDDSKEWGDMTEKIIRQLIEQDQSCNYKQVISPVKKYVVNYKKTLGYESYPKGYWDFIFIDGPPLIEEDSCLDPVRMNSINNQTIVQIDGRNSNVKYLSKHLKINKNSDWRRFRFAYPCDDTIFINVNNKNFSKVLSFFQGSLNDSIL